MAESQQHKMDRVRRPRVQITYDVETGGAMIADELPFVVGILADLSADNAKNLPKMAERKFVEVDRDNINDVIAKAAPEVGMRVEDRLSGDASKELAVNLKIKSMDDLEPAKIAEQVEPLKELLAMRKRLDEVLGKMEANAKLEGLLEEVMANNDKVKALAAELGLDKKEG